MQGKSEAPILPRLACARKVVIEFSPPNNVVLQCIGEVEARSENETVAAFYRHIVFFILNVSKMTTTEEQFCS